jgi:predicted ATPase/class 3 adenylate cyclase
MWHDLPVGTVTFLFTDVEGSTRLLLEVGDERYARILAEHHRVCRYAWQAHRGVEISTEGDAFFVVFERASDALTAAQAAQEALAGGPVKVRMGVHTGPVLLEETGYVGRELHLAARIASSGSGGQVILSRDTMELAGYGFVFSDLGEHRLKDIEHPVAIFQLGEGSYPPLRTISNTNLPRPAASFLGRQQELSELRAMIDHGARLVTLTGPGGTGKTRLALEAAASVVGSYKAGVFWVGLASVSDSALVMASIAQVLGAKDGLAEHIGERELLLLLDNLEQVIDVAPELGALLRACRHLTLLVTSRELLRVQGEVEYPVPPLAELDAVALFCERTKLASSVEVTNLCVGLDNLPLAIELAAARTSVLSPRQILQRISERLDLLKGGRDADPRQQTLRASIEWSYELLSQREQALFRQLSVFAGGCTLEVAEAVCDADLDNLQSLVEKSLLRFSAERYWMLETIRQYGAECLDQAGESHRVRLKHLTRHARLAMELAGPIRDRSPQAVAVIDAEHDNMRAALDFALEHDDVVTAGQLLSGLWFYWLTTGRGGEAVMWANRYVASSRERILPLDRYVGDDAAAEILRWAGDSEAAVQIKREMVATGRAHPDALVNGSPITGLTAATLSDLAWIGLAEDRVDTARSDAEEALAMRRDLGNPHGIAHALMAVAGVAMYEGDYSVALELSREAAGAYETVPNSESLEFRLMMAECELLLGRHEEAKALLREAFPGITDLPDAMMEMHALRVVGIVAAASGHAETCAALFGATDRMLQDSEVRVFTDYELGIHHSYLELARDALDELVFAAAYERGHEAPRDQVISLALSALE